MYDNNFNRDVWIVPIDKSRAPYNLSRHPDSDGGVRWSPDGKLLAFTGRRYDDETDIYYVWLKKSDDQALSRKRKLDKAVETIGKLRPKPKPRPAPKKDPVVEQKSGDAAAGKAGEENSLMKALRLLFGQPGAKQPATVKPKPTTGAAVQKRPPSPAKKKSAGGLVIDFDEIAVSYTHLTLPTKREE